MHFERTYGQVLDSLAARFPGAPALVDGDLRWDFSEAIGTIRAFGRALRDLGLNAGSRVGVAMGDTTALVVAAQGAMWAGITVVPLNIKLSSQNHAHMLADAAVDALLHTTETTAHADRIAELTPVPRMLDVDVRAGRLGTVDLTAFPTGPGAPGDARVDDEIWIQYTGGTTGLPKGVVHTHRTTLAALVGCATEFEFAPGERHAHVAPLTHGGFAAFLPVWLRGGCNVLTGGFDADRLLETIESERITSSLLVPTMITKLLASPKVATTDLTSVRTLVYGAAPITPTTLQRALDVFGPVLLQCYGQTECFSQISTLSKLDHVRSRTDPSILTSSGNPVMIADVRIGGDDGPAAPGELGEVLVRGPHVFTEYLNRPAETESALAGGWLHTGDIGRIDSDGRLHLVDRKKDVIISGGFNVYPKEIEDVVDAMTAVEAVCVVGLPDDVWGESVTAVIVASDRSDREQLADSIRTTVRERKGAMYAPKRVEFVSAIPLTAVGKYDKRAVVESLTAPHL